MIDLTPLDVRNKRGDFKKILRGYDPQEVDVFLELVAERLEMLVRENLQLKERAETLNQQVSSQSGREKAVQEALVTAQELRSDIRTQAQKEADLIVSEARAEARQKLADAERKVEAIQDGLLELERRRGRFLKAFRQLLERELEVVEVEEERAPLEERTIDLDLGGGKQEPDLSGDGGGGDTEAVEELAEADQATAAEGAPTAEDADTDAAADTDVDASAEADAAEKVPTDVDASAEARPPLDAPVDELATSYGGAGEEAASGAEADQPEEGASDDETLFLSFQEEQADEAEDSDEGEERWSPPE